MVLAVANDNGCRFGHHCCRWTSPNSIKQEAIINKLISTLIYWIYLIASTGALRWACARLPTPQAAWAHQIHAAGGAAPTPWWCCLSCCLCFLCGFWLVTCQWYSSYVHVRGVTKWATQACTIPCMELARLSMQKKASWVLLIGIGMWWKGEFSPSIFILTSSRFQWFFVMKLVCLIGCLGIVLLNAPWLFCPSLGNSGWWGLPLALAMQRNFHYRQRRWRLLWSGIPQMHGAKRMFRGHSGD